MSEIKFQRIEYLAVTKAYPNDTPHEPVVVLTIRPDESGFRLHNCGVTLPQAKRLCRDLRKLLKAATAGLLLLPVFVGCSGEVDFSRETTIQARTDLGTAAIEFLANRQAADSRPPALQIDVGGSTFLVVEPESGSEELLIVEVRREGNGINSANCWRLVPVR